MNAPKHAEDFAKHIQQVATRKWGGGGGVVKQDAVTNGGAGNSNGGGGAGAVEATSEASADDSSQQGASHSSAAPAPEREGDSETGSDAVTNGLAASAVGEEASTVGRLTPAVDDASGGEADELERLMQANASAFDALLNVSLSDDDDDDTDAQADDASHGDGGGGVGDGDGDGGDGERSDRQYEASDDGGGASAGEEEAEEGAGVVQGGSSGNSGGGSDAHDFTPDFTEDIPPAAPALRTDATHPQPSSVVIARSHGVVEAQRQAAVAAELAAAEEEAARREEQDTRAELSMFVPRSVEGVGRNDHRRTEAPSPYHLSPAIRNASSARRRSTPRTYQQRMRDIHHATKSHRQRMVSGRKLRDSDRRPRSMRAPPSMGIAGRAGGGRSRRKGLGRLQRPGSAMTAPTPARREYTPSATVRGQRAVPATRPSSSPTRWRDESQLVPGEAGAAGGGAAAGRRLSLASEEVQGALCSGVESCCVAGMDQRVCCHTVALVWLACVLGHCCCVEPPTLFCWGCCVRTRVLTAGLRFCPPTTCFPTMCVCVCVCVVVYVCPIHHSLAVDAPATRDAHGTSRAHRHRVCQDARRHHDCHVRHEHGWPGATPNGDRSTPPRRQPHASKVRQGACPVDACRKGLGAT